MTEHTKPIAESNSFIILDKYVRDWEAAEGYQSEADLERELIADLVDQGYDYLPELNTPIAMLANVREQLQVLSNVGFSDGEWLRFVETYLDKPSDNIAEKTRKIHDDYIHDFVFDDGHIQNIYLLDKKNIARNKVQVIKQFEITGKHTNRYDVTILVNGLPLVQIELKKRGVAIREAFNKIHRYRQKVTDKTVRECAAVMGVYGNAIDLTCEESYNFLRDNLIAIYNKQAVTPIYDTKKKIQYIIRAEGQKRRVNAEMFADRYEPIK